MANIITLTRIIGALLLIPLKMFSNAFFGVYVYCGISDILDGYIARKTKTTSRLGAKLDSISDLLFYTVMMVKILPHLKVALPGYVFTLIYGVLLLRVGCYLLNYFYFKEFSSRHTYWNKTTGFLIFFVPFFIYKPFFFWFSLLVILIAYIAVLDEINYVLKRHKGLS